MRNIFDQYTQWENRLTHALVTALAEDRKLLRAFVHWVMGAVPKSAKLQIVEQRLPGEAELTEGESERRGLPDAWIHDNNSWCLLVESKVAAKLSNDQLRRHLQTANRRGFDEIFLLVLDVVEPRDTLPDGVIFRQWRDVYQWLIGKGALFDWAQRTAQYLEIAENRMVAEGYLMEGALTTFSGIPFHGDEPYSYPEAKRVLKLALEKLRDDSALKREIRMDRTLPGRDKITGKGGIAVWDFLQLKRVVREDSFTKYPHLTLAIESDRLLAMVTVPHGIKSASRRNLVDLGIDGFEDLLKEVNKRLVVALRKTKGAAPWCIVVQRRYPSQSAAAIVDARIEYDLRTAFQQNGDGAVIKTQPQWMQATYEALSNKRSNLQVSIGAIFPYDSGSTTNPTILNTVADVWIACKPLLEALLQNEGR